MHTRHEENLVRIFDKIFGFNGQLFCYNHMFFLRILLKSNFTRQLSENLIESSQVYPAWLAGGGTPAGQKTV
jgi:hypothetical protein